MSKRKRTPKNAPNDQAAATSIEDAELAALLDGGSGADPPPAPAKPKRSRKKRAPTITAPEAVIVPEPEVLQFEDDRPLGGSPIAPEPSHAPAPPTPTPTPAPSTPTPERSAPPCPKCACRHCPVQYTRAWGNKTIRRRRCRNCSREFTSTESTE